MNTTDVDDKTIKGAEAVRMNLKDFTLKYEASFKDDSKKLSIKPATKLVRATEHIAEMIKLISRLLDAGIAYEKNGSVYFAISKFKAYGRLAHLDQKGLKAGARVDIDEYEKNEAQDFVLWKAKKDEEPTWVAPFGEGRPGWHIECSAMSMKYLGETFDIHTGGVDLIFPHHENEIAQSETATGKKFVNYWIHGEHLLVDGKRMAKSFNNFYTLRDIEERGLHPLSYRYLVLTSHYRSKLNFTWKSLEAAQTSLERLYDFACVLKETKTKGKQKLNIYMKEFGEALSNNLDTPKALATVWKLVHAYNKKPEAFNTKEVLALLYNFDTVLGLELKTLKKELIPGKIKALVKKREELRESKNWQEADNIRKEIEINGFEIFDTPHGPEIRKK